MTSAGVLFASFAAIRTASFALFSSSIATWKSSCVDAPPLPGVVTRIVNPPGIDVTPRVKEKRAQPPMLSKIAPLPGPKHKGLARLDQTGDKCCNAESVPAKAISVKLTSIPSEAGTTRPPAAIDSAGTSACRQGSIAGSSDPASCVPETRGRLTWRPRWNAR
jgi:hypothetical protein